MTDDEILLRQFEDCTLPMSQWTHSAHVKMAYLYLLRHPVDVSIDLLRKKIQALNAAHGVPDSPTRGYHETMTQSWVRVIAAMLTEYGPADSAEAFLQSQPQLGEKYLLRLFYSRDRLMSADAKVRFVEPDLAPLPGRSR